METLTLIDHPLVTFDAVVEGGSPNKFPSAFDHVATLLPFDIRSFLVHYWRAYPDAPCFALANRHFLDVQTHGRPHAALAVTDGTGRHFCFANLAVMAMPDQVVHSLIAHELAHATLAAEYFTDCLPGNEREALTRIDADSPLELRDWHEHFADQRANGWSDTFDCDALRQWCSDHLVRHGVLTNARDGG